MIKFGNPHIKREEEYSILENSVEIDGVQDTIWFKIRKEYEPYLCTERSDAYLIAVLNYAMVNHHDMQFETPVSEELLFSITTYLIPALIENNPEFHFPSITAKTSNEPLTNLGAVGTGISCGVDSLQTLAANDNLPFDSLKITHLTFNNVGSHGEGEKARDLYRSRLENPRKFAEEFGFHFIESDSNLMDIIHQNHFKTHTYSSMFPVFCLQKLFKTFFYASSGYTYKEFNLKDGPTRSSGAYELLSLPIFSTSNLRIYSGGMGLTRLGKLKDVVKYEPSFNYLNVCLKEGKNCGRCEKCIRTLLGLDILGALELYRNVFDIDYYKNNKKWYLKQMMTQIAYKKHDYIEMYPFFKDQVSLSMKLNVLPIKIKMNIRDFLLRWPKIYKFARKINSPRR